jgi:hypothetical protein
MRLNETQVKQTLNQLNAQVLPDDHPAIGKLSELFGDHTFFVDESGLKVLDSPDPREGEAQTGTVISLADWNDGTFSSLNAHEPEPTGDVVVLAQSKH